MPWKTQPSFRSLKTRTIVAALAASISWGITSVGQEPPGWTHAPNMEKQLGEGKWYVNWKAKEVIPVRVIEKKIVIKIDQLNTLITAAVNATTMKIASLEVPEETKFPCMSLIGTTGDNYPAELHVIITEEHVFSLYTITLGTWMPRPSRVGFDLAEWQSAITSEKPMRPEKHSKYQHALSAIKSKLDSLRGEKTTGKLK